MSTSVDARRTWRLGYAVLLVAPFIGLPLVLTDAPRWLEIVAVAAILVVVGTGSSMMRHRAGGWRPSETLIQPRDDGR